MVITDVNQVVYQGDGETTTFPFTFRIIDATDVKLLLIDAGGTETDITSDYFVDINTNTVHYPGYAPGSEPAEADQPAPVQTGQKLMIYRKLPITQEKDMGDKWPFYVIELGLDKLTMILQDIWDWCGRCLQVSRGQAADAGDDFDPTIPLEAGKVVIGNDAGTGFSSAKALLYKNDGWDAEGQSISNVATPGNVKDATTKEYVDNLIDKLSVEADRYVVFNNVAAMKAADLPAGYNTRTLGYHDINDGGAGTYSIRGKVAGETEDGGSVIFLENGNVAELIIIDEVNINQFGAVGDDVTDDNVAIVNAVTYASAKNKRLVFLEGYIYYTSLGIVITNPPDEIRMDGMLRYDGSGTALTIGDASVSIGNKILKLSVRGSSLHTAGSKGVVLYNLNNSQIYLYKVQYFGDTAVTYCGNTKGFAYNTTIVGHLYSTPTLLKLTNIGAGWCNENKFFGGRFSGQSTDSFKASVIGVLITSDDNDYAQNGNIFYSPSFEIATGVKIERGQYNFFYDCRTEGSTNPLLIDETNKSNAYNYMSSAYGVYKYTPKYGNIYDDGNHRMVEQLLSHTIFDSGIVSNNLASDGTKTAFAKLCTIYKSGTNVLKGIASARASIVDGKLYTTSGISENPLGVIIDTTNNKKLCFQFTGNGSGRQVVGMWDADGNMITDENPLTMSLQGHSVSTLSVASERTWYVTGATNTFPDKWILLLPDKCVKAFVGIAGSKGITVERIAISGANPSTYETLQNYETAVLDTIPTSVGKVGQFVKKNTPTQGEIGWVYDGTQWLTVG